MILLPLPLRRALKSGGFGRIAMLAEIDHPDGVVRCWSRIGTLRYLGVDWQGTGPLGRVSGIGGSLRVEVRPITFTLIGVPPASTQFLETNVRNRAARVWMAALRPRSNAIDGDLHPLCEGRCNTMTLKVDGQRRATIDLVVNDPIYVVDRGQSLAYTSEWLKRTHGEELTGGDLIPELVHAEDPWTQS